jgi:hypothetical protein
MSFELTRGLTHEDGEKEENEPTRRLPDDHVESINAPHERRGEVMSTRSETGVRELDRRRGEGIDVTLLWDPQTNRVFVAVADERHGSSFEVDVEAADAFDAFHHPYTYAGRSHGDVYGHAA